MTKTKVAKGLKRTLARSNAIALRSHVSLVADDLQGCVKHLETQRRGMVGFLKEFQISEGQPSVNDSDFLGTLVRKLRSLESTNIRVIQRLQQMKRLRCVVDDLRPQFEESEMFELDD